MAKKMSRKDRKKRAEQAQESLQFLRAIVDGAANASMSVGQSDYDTVMKCVKDACNKVGLDKRLSFILRLSVTWQMRPFLRKLRSIFRRKKAYHGQPKQIYDYIYDSISRSLKSKYKRAESEAEKKKVLYRVVYDNLLVVLKSVTQGKPIVQQKISRSRMM